MIDYRIKLTTARYLNSMSDINSSVESDRGRIVSSPALRRLQKRTQVFALELNAAVRSRLTHSLEVSQNARYIAKSILAKLNEPSLMGLENAFVSTAEMASLLHDIGNPPFGHFGEMAINDWMKRRGLRHFEAIESSNPTLKAELARDLSNFDGNAQAIRIVDKLQRLNLSYTQVGSILKYTRGAYEERFADLEFGYLRKKPGYFYSEKAFIETLSASLQLKPSHRFPLTYIMEAADDISYLTADIEDAVDKGILTLEQVYKLIMNASKGKGVLLANIVEKNYKKAKEAEDEPYQFNMFLTLTRAQLVRELVEYVSTLYVQHHEAIFEGSFNYSLLGFDPTHECSMAVEVLQNISTKHIYNHKQVQALELKGYSVLQGLFDLYEPLLTLSSDDFSKLQNGEKVDCLLCKNLYARLPKKHLVAYAKSVAQIKEDYQILEWYSRARLIIDYISGMTDDYTLHEYATLHA